MKTPLGRTCALLLALLAVPALGFDLQGHRGARGLAPENTLAAFDLARSIGVTTLELDTALTKDGVVVISHDMRLNPDLTRDADGRWLDAPGPPIHTLSLAELRGYDVGRLKPDTQYAQTWAQQRPVDGQRIPTLAQLFERVAAAGDTRLRFNIETKLRPDDDGATPDAQTFARAVLDVVRAHRLESRVSIQSFDWRTLRELRRLAPRIPTGCLTARQSWMNNLDDPRWTGSALAAHGHSVPRLVKAAGCKVWSPYFGELSADSLAEARARGLKVVVWTVNRPEDIERMLALGVDGLISDYPDRARELLKGRGIALR